jgi:hypothetical protein
MTRKIAEPMIAAARCTIGSYSTPPRIVRIGRALASRDVLREVLVAFESAIEVARVTSEGCAVSPVISA